MTDTTPVTSERFLTPGVAIAIVDAFAKFKERGFIPTTITRRRPRPFRVEFFKAPHFTLVKEVLIEIGCVVTSLVVGRWLVVTRVHCGQTVHPRPIVTMEH